MNYQNQNGETALMAAASFGHLDAASLLLKNGADSSLKDGRGWDAGDWAIQLSNWNFVKYQAISIIS